MIRTYRTYNTYLNDGKHLCVYAFHNKIFKIVSKSTKVPRIIIKKVCSMLTQSINSYTFYCHILKSTDSCKM